MVNIVDDEDLPVIELSIDESGDEVESPNFNVAGDNEEEFIIYKMLTRYMRKRLVLFIIEELVAEVVIVFFVGCLGALDATYIDLHVPLCDKPRFRTRKGRISMNVLGACDRNMMFVYVLPGWEGSAADYRVLRNAVLRPNGLKVPKGIYCFI
ncbi:hypothetical protein ACS0TY_018559 [Phlomoides rotata]